MQRQGETSAETAQQYRDYAALDRLVVSELGGEAHLSLPFYAIDFSSTNLRDDAVALRPHAGGWEVYTAISPVSRYSTLHERRADRTYEVSPSTPRGHALRRHSLHGKRKEAFVLKYWTDGARYANPEVFVGTVRVVQRTHETLPGRVLEEICAATATTTSHCAVMHLMHVHNILVAAWMHQHGTPIPYRNTLALGRGQSVPYYTAEPLPSDRAQPVSTRATCPLRDDVSRVTGIQSFARLDRKKPLPSDTIAGFAQYRNRLSVHRQERELHVIEGLAAVLPYKEEILAVLRSPASTDRKLRQVAGGRQKGRAKTRRRALPYQLTPVQRSAIARMEPRTFEQLTEEMLTERSLQVQSHIDALSAILELQESGQLRVA